MSKRIDTARYVLSRVPDTADEVVRGARAVLGHAERAVKGIVSSVFAAADKVLALVCTALCEVTDIVHGDN